MKKAKPETEIPPPEPPPETSAPSLAALADEAQEACAFVHATKARREEAARLGGVEPYRAKLESLMATARTLLPLAEAYWRTAAPVVSDARELPWGPMFDMQIGRADVSGTLRQYKKGLEQGERFLAGECQGDLGLAAQEIEQLLTCAPFIPTYHEQAFADLCQAIAEIRAKTARQADRPAGPTLQPPDPRPTPSPPREAAMKFNVFDFGKEN